MELADVPAVATLMHEIIRLDPSYISHGELQMGIGTAPGVLSEKAEAIIAEELGDQIRGGAGGMWVLLEETRLVGFISARVEEQFHNRYGVIADLGIAPCARRKGYGTLLMQAALASFSEGGATQAFLESGVANHSAHEFFARFGFSTCSKVLTVTLPTTGT